MKNLELIYKGFDTMEEAVKAASSMLDKPNETVLILKAPDESFWVHPEETYREDDDADTEIVDIVSNIPPAVYQLEEENNDDIFK
jgi:hypothetical protein